MTSPAIITVAITGSQPTKEQNPAVPIHPAEQVESTQEAFEAGASLVQFYTGLIYRGPGLVAEVARALRAR